MVVCLLACLFIRFMYLITCLFIYFFIYLLIYLNWKLFTNKKASVIYHLMLSLTNLSSIQQTQNINPYDAPSGSPPPPHGGLSTFNRSAHWRLAFDYVLFNDNETPSWAGWCHSYTRVLRALSSLRQHIVTSVVVEHVMSL